MSSHFSQSAEGWDIAPGSLGRPLIIAHRGDVESAPENTLEAFLSAAERGADGVELDVRLSREDRVVVMHDRRIDRTTNGRGPVGIHTLAELKHLDAGSWFHPRFGDATVPTLDEVFDALPSRFLVAVELKVRGWGVKPLVSATLECIKRAKRWKSTMVTSFNPVALMAMRLMEPRVMRGYIWCAQHPFPISQRWLSPMAKAHWMDPDLKTFNAKVLRHFHGQGKPVLAWDLDAGRDIKRLSAMGVDGVVTDRLTGLVG